MRARATLRAHPLPEGAFRIWDAFSDLDRWRGGGGMGMTPLTLHDIEAYERRYDVAFDLSDVELLKRIDFERLIASSPKATT